VKKVTVVMLIIIALLTISSTALAELEIEVEAEANLDGSQEVPPVATDMTGEVEIEIDDGKLEFELEVENNSHEIFAAHIHCGVPGENGPVGVTLFMGSFTDSEGTLAEGVITAPDDGNGCSWEDLDDVAIAIASRAAYVNVHTTADSGGVPSGEIRGDLVGDDVEVEVDAEADLNGGQEVPPVATAMTGKVEVEIDDGKLEFELEVEDNSHEIFAAHIHCGVPGENGPVGVTLFMGSFTDREGTLAEGVITAPDDGNGCGWESLNDVATAIANGATYVNVHTTADSGGVPSGEIRGNLVKGDLEVEVETKANLSGSQEVPPVDTNMRGKVEIEIDDGKLEFELEVRNNSHEIFAAHIHCGVPGENGPVGVTLFMGSFTDRRGTLAEGVITAPDDGNGCGWEDLDDVAIAIASRAAYVNVHTTADSGGVPSGEIRGDLSRVDFEVEAEADLSGGQEVPPVATAMTGEVEIEIDDGKLEFELEVEDNSHEIFAAHIHCGIPGENGPVGVTLFMGSFTREEGTLAEGVIRAPDDGNGCGWEDLDDVAIAIASGATYVNVHTTADSGGVPSGEIRGNLR